MPKINAYEVAKLAHVSPATVSRAINHRSTVNAKTLRQIDDAMRQLHYQSAAAEGPKVVIVNVPDLSNVFSTEVIKGINAAATANNLFIMINQTTLQVGNVDDYLKTIETFHPYGMILLNKLSLPVLNKLAKVTRIVQCSEHNPDSKLPFVGIDDYQAAFKATTYLISTGRKRLCLINANHKNQYATQRQRGFLDAIQQSGLDLIDNWQLAVDVINYDIAYAMIDQLLSNVSYPDGFVGVSDTVAAAVIKAASKYHINVPQDISVIGFDNTLISKVTEPALSTVNVPTFQQGYSAVETLVNSYNQDVNLKLPVELLIRQSTL